ncbi:MAG: L,D-transpeptidase [Rhizobacter sp.]|nr:L,D-transpeptidase [Rhizobacter sp.]
MVLTLPPASVAISQLNSSRLAFAEVNAADRPPADFALHPASADARFVADWVTQAQDNRRLPFVILDKREAMVFVFDANGRIIDASPVLLGAAVGDDSVAGIGERPIEQVHPSERTTPAGRFVSQPGKNSSGEEVVWVDYAAAVSMHRVRLVDPKERRLERLASPDPTQRRISYGCINVPVAFFDSVIWPVIGTARGVVYVLPETRPVREVFAGISGR